MKSRLLTHLDFTGLFALLNLLFWLIFGVLFVAGSYPYRPHKLFFEEATPSYIFFGRALREIDSGTGTSLPPPLMNVTRAIQKPSFVAAKPYFWYFNSHGLTVDHQYWGISVGGYYLLLVCVLSFFQWYLIGWVVQKLWDRWSSHPTTGPSHAPSTPTTR
jgi:hypothetical protein